MKTTKTRLVDYGSTAPGSAMLTTWENAPDEMNAGHAAKLIIPGGAGAYGHATRAAALIAAARELEHYARQLRALADAEPIRANSVFAKTGK